MCGKQTVNNWICCRVERSQALEECAQSVDCSRGKYSWEDSVQLQERKDKERRRAENKHCKEKKTMARQINPTKWR